MKHFAAKHRFLAVTLGATLLIGASTASSIAVTNFTFAADVTIQSNLTVYSINLSGQTLTNWPGIGAVLTYGSDAGNIAISDIAELLVNDRFHAFSGQGGAGVYAIENDYSEEMADFAVAYSDGNFFSDALSGDMCLRSLGGSIRIGNYDTGLSYNSSLVVGTNGAVTVTSGPLYITPQGDLTMGSYTNSPPH